MVDEEKMYDDFGDFDVTKYDYEVVVGMVTVLAPRNYEKELKEQTILLPSIKGLSSWQGWTELTDALKESGIPDQTFHYTDLCCKNAQYFFGRSNETPREFVEYFRKMHDCRRPRKYIMYCPFCGKRLLINYKNLGKFKFGKVKKEVCSIKYSKVD